MRSAPLRVLVPLLVVAALAACARPGGSRGAPSTPADDEDCELGADVVGGRVEPFAQDVVIPARKKAWEASLGGEEAARPHVAARLAGWPTRRLIDPKTLPAADGAFLERLARDTWRGLAAFTDREHALPVDHVHLGAGSLARGDARVGDYTNVTTVGMHMIAIVAARDLGLLDAEAAVAEIGRVLDTLDRLETHAGFFFNYYDTTSLERSSNFVSFVDSSWLTAGLVVVRNAFPALAARCSRLVAAQDYGFFYDPAIGRMTHGYYVHRGARSRYHYGVLYAESRLGSLIAIGKGDVPEAHWFDLVRTYPAACGWQQQAPRARVRRSVDGHTVWGGYYEWSGVKYVPSWGGSMFEALMPTLVLDEVRHAPASLGANDVAHAEVQRRWAIETLGYSVWGLSPATAPGSTTYAEYGATPLGILGYRPGAVTPHAAALALTVTPSAAVAALRALATRFPLYGDFGLYDAVDPQTGVVAETYLTLDQAMTFIALTNHLRGGSIQRRFDADPIATRAVAVIAGERFFD